MSKESQLVPFRLIQCPHCKILLCYINPRLPNYCSECGTFIFHRVRSCILQTYRDAWLTYETD